jgi:ADP-heptose:LPS heptosyltransferase
MHIDRITIFKGGALGDFLLTLPVLAALRARFPDSRIRLITAPERAFLVQHLRFEVLDSGRREWTGLFNPACPPDQNPLSLLKDESLFIAVSEAGLSPLPYLHPLARCISIPSFPPPGEQIHITDFLFQRLREAGLSLPVPSAFSLQSSADFSFPPSAFFVIHPGSGSPRKNWPAENFVSIARSLKKDRRLTPVILGGEADGKTLERLRRMLEPGEALFLEIAPLQKAAAILSRAVLYLGNDSGITHLASMLGVPVIALFGATDQQIWGPRGRRVEIILGTAPCAPCDAEKRRRCPDNVCMKSIAGERILEATELLFAKPL